MHTPTIWWSVLLIWHKSPELVLLACSGRRRFGYRGCSWEWSLSFEEGHWGKNTRHPGGGKYRVLLSLVCSIEFAFSYWSIFCRDFVVFPSWYLHPFFIWPKLVNFGCYYGGFGLSLEYPQPSCFEILKNFAWWRFGTLLNKNCRTIALLLL